MLVDSLKKHVEALTFIHFREVARRYIQNRGFRGPVVTDGWSDGGTDLRVYEVGATEPRRVAIQVSVELDWKGKIKSDAAKALKNLGCNVFIYVSNRRVPDAQFQPVADKLLSDKGISASKADRDNVAQF